MSKMTTRGNKRIAAKIDVMTTSKRTIGATKATPAPDVQRVSKPDRAKSVSARNIGKRVAKKTKK